MSLVGKASSSKGARGELEAAALLCRLLFDFDCTGVPSTEWPVRRMLGAGRADDVGDLWGTSPFCVQVAYRANLGQVLGDKADSVARQQDNAGEPYSVLMMKLPPRPGGKPPRWRFVLTEEQFAAIFAALQRQP